MSAKSRFSSGADRLGVLMSSVGTDIPVPADQLEPLYNAIKRELTCPEEDPQIFGVDVEGNFNEFLPSREGRPPSCFEPIVPTKADPFDRADLMVQVQPTSFGSSENTLDFFPRNISGNPKAELTVPACCFSRPPSTVLDRTIFETNFAFFELGQILGVPGVPPPPTLYEGSGMPVEESVNAQTEVTQDNANHKDFIEMLRKFGLAITVALSNLFGVSAAGDPNAQEVVGTVTVSGPFPWVEVSGDLMDDGTFVADGRGTVAGFPDIAVSFAGTLTPGGIVGDYTMGAEGGLPQGAAMQSITGELLRTEAGLLYLDAEGAETMPGDGLRGVETALSELADAVAGSTLISREQTEADLRQAAAQFGEAAGLMDQVSALARVAPTGTTSQDIQQLLDSLRATAPLLDAVRVSALGNSFTTVSAAGYTGPVASASIVAGFGVTGAADGAAQMIPLPTSLGGVSIRVTDSEGADSAAEFFFSSNLQSNFLIPAGAALGDAVVTVFQGDQILATGSVRIEPIAPALFTANNNGMGVAAARFILVLPDNSQVEDFIFDPNLPVGSRTALPIDLSGEGELVFLVLFGTGIRGFTDEVTATVGGVAVPVPAALAHADLVGLDQANLGPIPPELIGAGEVEIILVVDGVAANAVTVRFL